MMDVTSNGKFSGNLDRNRPPEANSSSIGICVFTCFGQIFGTVLLVIGVVFSACFRGYFGCIEAGVWGAFGAGVWSYFKGGNYWNLGLVLLCFWRKKRLVFGDGSTMFSW